MRDDPKRHLLVLFAVTFGVGVLRIWGGDVVLGILIVTWGCLLGPVACVLVFERAQTDRSTSNVVMLRARSSSTR